MRINEVDKEVTKVQLDALERALDKLFAGVGIDVEFTRHFLDRVNDERNIKQITLSELAQLFKKEFVRYGKPIAQLGPDAEAVMKDLASNINIPFALNWDKSSGMLELVAKTVMRKKNFGTSNKEFAVESALPKLSGGGVLGTGLDPAQFQSKYGVSPKVAQTSINNVVKLRPGFSNPRVANAITQYMLDTPGSLKSSNDNRAPKTSKLPKWIKGIAGRILGPLGLIFTPSPAGETPQDLEILRRMQEIENWFLYNDPQAFVDLYRSEWEKLSDKEKKRDASWDPNNNPNFQNAKDAANMLKKQKDIIDKRHQDLLDRLTNPKPNVKTDSPKQPKLPNIPSNPKPGSAIDGALPHMMPGQPGMPELETQPDWWPSEVVPYEPGPQIDTQPPKDLENPDFDPKNPEVKPSDDKEVDKTVPSFPAVPPKGDKFVEPESPVEPTPKGPKVDTTSPEELPDPNIDITDPVAPSPSTDPEIDPTAPKRVTQPDRGDPLPSEPSTDPAPGKRPEVPNAPKQPTQPDFDPKNPEVPGPSTDPEIDPTIPKRITQPDRGDPLPSEPSTDPAPGKRPEVPNAPKQPTQPDFDPKNPEVPAPDNAPVIDPMVPARPSLPSKPDTFTEPKLPGTLSNPDTGGSPDIGKVTAPTPTPPTKTSKNKTKKRRKIDYTGDDDLPYNDPLQRWQRKYGMFENTNLGAYLFESGSMEGVGLIHKDEINPTLAELEKHLKLNLSNFTLGSVGKKEFSGDIDVAINIPPEQIPAFIEKLKKSPLILDINVPIDTIITKLKIVNYDESKKPENDNRPRTGYVQLDFMPGDPGWLKTYYHSPSEDESKYKGVFRNIMMAEIAANYNRQDSEQKLEDGRPKERIRYKWSPKEGLLKVKRTPVMNKKGTGYTKKNQDETIEGPWKQADQIAKELNLDSAANLNSFETLLSAIEKNYTAEVVQRIKQGMIRNHQVQDIGIPDELS